MGDRLTPWSRTEGRGAARANETGHGKLDRAILRRQRAPLDTLGEYWKRLAPPRVRRHVRWWLPVVIGLLGGVPGVLVLKDKWGISLASWVWTLLLVLILLTLNVRQFYVWRHEVRHAARHRRRETQKMRELDSTSAHERLVVPGEQEGSELELNTHGDQEKVWRPYTPTWQDAEYRQGEEAKRALRKTRGLEPLSEFQEGLTAASIDHGTYAFAFPSSLDAHRFSRVVNSLLGQDSSAAVSAEELHVQSDEGFAGSKLEVHRTTSGEVELVGFVSVQDKHRISRGTGGEISLFTRRTRSAKELVSLPLSEIASSSSHDVRRSASRLDLELNG